jgi:hypothetical protein
MCCADQLNPQSIPDVRDQRPRPSAEAVKTYGAGARSPLKSKVPTAVSTLHVTTALPL